jgi:hypothetical protein
MANDAAHEIREFIGDIPMGMSPSSIYMAPWN